MPTITTKRPGVCGACGQRVRKGEYADFTAEQGLRHVEPACRKGPTRYRPNERPDTCGCGAFVAAREGRLRLLSDVPGQGKRWAVDCARCSR